MPVYRARNGLGYCEAVRNKSIHGRNWNKRHGYVSVCDCSKWAVLFQMMKVEIDEQLMKNIARKTDGKYFRATSNSKLAEIYASINKLKLLKLKN
jgi:hypothetical protein